ncbi:MAG: ABC-F family ATP-binding cassette domain-containing protein [Ruminococcus sp.]|nr:ABC-F family ATP-binding cassette domain-containing protein [Ruminococcus sp.]
MLLNIENIYKYFNGESLLRDISLTIEDREAVGLIGSNGCGKTTLLNIITGSEGFDKTADGLGSVSISSKATIGYLRQNSGLDTQRTILEEMKDAFSELYEIKARMKELSAQMETASGDELENISEEYAHLGAYFEARDGYRMDVRIKQVLSGMGFADTDTSQIVATLSGGEKTRLALAKLLLEEPNLLILDEPTNHLDFAALMWLEDHLKSYKGALLIVSHDRYFINKVCTRICEISQGHIYSYKGDYNAYLLQKKMRDERQLKEYEAQQKEIAKLEDYIARNKVRASTAKMAKSRQHMLDRIERVDKPVMYTQPPKIKLEYDIEPTKDIVRVVSCPLVVGEGDKKKTLINSLDMHIRRGEHVGIIGANGIGKSSVLKLIQGLIPHDSGNISWGNNVKISYFDQEHTALDRHNTVIGEVQRKRPRLSDGDARNVLASVLIRGEDVFKPVSVISGGERAKLYFAMMALDRANVLILDEPTNHLDMMTKEVLENALAEFGGTIILVSHDRYLLNKVAGRIIEIKADEVNSYEGDFDAYAEAVAAQQQALQAAENEKKQAAAQAAYEQNKQQSHRSKQQRANDAKRRERIRALEKEIEQTEQLIAQLESEIADPAIASDYALINEKCSQLDEARNAIEEKMDEWAELADM